MTTDKLRTYHRTYLSIYHDTGPFIQGCNPNREEQRQQKQLQDFRVNQLPRLEQMRKGPPTENTRRVLAEMMGITYIQGRAPSDQQIAEFERAGSQFKTAPMPAREPHLRQAPGRRHDAYMIEGDSLAPTKIEEKKDQTFAPYATPWEKAYSVLAHGTNRCIPIVDSNREVVGHYGQFSGHHLQIKIDEDPREIFVSRYSVDEMLDMAQITIPIGRPTGKMIGDKPVVSYYRDGYTDWRPSYEQYMVQTDIDGEVISAQYVGAGNNGAAVPVDYSPADLIGGAKLILQIGYKIVAKAAMKSIASKVIRRRVSAALIKRIKLSRGYHKAMGIPSEHYDAMVAAARETDVIAIFRANKDVAIPLIRKGSPGKPMIFKFKTSKDTGVLTAQTADDIALVEKHGYFLMGVDGVARRKIMKEGKEVVEELRFKNPYWKVEKNQVIDPTLQKPVVGDYDLLGVAPLKSPGSSVAGVPKDIETGDWTGPWVQKYAAAANKQMGNPPRVLHGAQDQYGGVPKYMGLTDDTAYAVFPDGRVHIMTGKQAQQEFYDAIGRKSAADAFPRPAPGVVVKDELAAKRAQKAGKRF
jgi:hypothetical protein